jgi:hypothetical protein
MLNNLKVKIAVRARNTWSEVQPQEFVLAYTAAVPLVLQRPLGDGSWEWRIKEHSALPAILL